MEFEKVRDIIVETLGCDAEQVTMDASLADDLGADSLASVELVMALEEATGISIEDSALAEMKTVGDVINYLNTRAVYVSGGSACDKGEPSHTLLAMGCADLTVRTALRVSFCADNTAEDVDALLDGVRDGLKELQHI